MEIEKADFVYEHSKIIMGKFDEFHIFTIPFIVITN